MGSQTHSEDLAYISGFLDGDGSLMLQIKKRKDSKLGWRFMFTICFYQDSRHEKPLYWIRKRLHIGYISRRNDHITELRINGYEQVKRILCDLLPFIRFKRKQAMAIERAAGILSKKPTPLLTRKNRLHIAQCILTVQHENYTTRQKKTKSEIMRILDLTP